jgi:hypothetical protein
MQQKVRKLVSPAAYARSRGLNRSTISRQIRDGKIPTLEGMLDPEIADLAREKNLDQGKRSDEAVRKAQRDDATKRAAVPSVPVPTVQHSGAPVAHAAVVDALRRVTAPLEILAFAKVALAAGASPTIAFVLGVWYATAPVMALAELDDNDIRDFGEPTEAEWRELLGGDFDFDDAGEVYDRATETGGGAR